MVVQNQAELGEGKNENVVKEVVNAAQDSTAVTTITITTEEITLAQALKALKTSKPKVKGIVFQETEPVKPMKKKVQIMLDEEVALKLQAKFDEERLAREKVEKEKEANIALIEEWDDIQAKITDDYQLAERLQAEEQEELSVEEKAKLFQQLLEQRRTTFLLKVQKRRGTNHQPKLNKENSCQKVDEDKDTIELQSLMEVILDEEEVAIDVVPLATKSLNIVDWKIHNEGKKSYYQK
ncbi:hypothetical protein Tco_1534968 [Tanacetum coccineum]